jgi:hypothetical protein
MTCLCGQDTWITAATRERFGYCAWRVKRCLMKQVCDPLPLSARSLFLLYPCAPQSAVCNRSEKGNDAAAPLSQGIAVQGTREDYGYRSWLVRKTVEGNSTLSDRVHFGTSSAVNPIATVRKRAQQTKTEGFWAPTNTKCRIQAACLEADKACFRQISPRGKLPMDSYEKRVKSALTFDPSPPSVVRSALNEGPAKKAWSRHCRCTHHISGGLPRAVARDRQRYNAAAKRLRAQPPPTLYLPLFTSHSFPPTLYLADTPA